MTTTEQNTDPTLRQQIDAFKAQNAKQAPLEIQAKLQQYISDLISSNPGSQYLKQGATAPDFTLPDALGHAVSLSAHLQQGPVVLAFYRGEWCPYCNMQLHAYQNIVPQLQELGATLIAVSPQTPDHSLSMAEKHALSFSVVSDAGNQVARQYGLVFSMDESYRPFFKNLGVDLPAFNGDASWELPVPGTFVIAQDGQISFSSADADFTHRVEPSTLLEEVRKAKHTA